MGSNNFNIAYQRQLRGTTITHVLSVYTTEQRQQQTLHTFFTNNHEVLAQRGHSYWRSKQLLEPMQHLAAQKQLHRNHHYFLSLGSCGGMKAYGQLYTLFGGSVDILATIGTGLAFINNPYNVLLPELATATNNLNNWEDVAALSAHIFQGGRGQDYLQPGSLAAIVHKIHTETIKSSLQ